jgi:hypothetical protein
MKKLTFALSAATALAAATIGLAAPAVAAPSAVGPARDTVGSVAANHSIHPVDACTVHVLYQGSVVDVQWC